MFNRIAKYWRGISLATLVTLPNIWEGVKWFWDWFGRFDVVASDLHDLRGLEPVIDFLTNPPPWTTFPSVLVAVAVILWDVLRSAPRRYRQCDPRLRHTMDLMGSG